MVSLTKQKSKHPKNWADAAVFVPVSDRRRWQLYQFKLFGFVDILSMPFVLWIELSGSHSQLE